MGLILISLMANDAEHPFVCLWAIRTHVCESYHVTVPSVLSAAERTESHAQWLCPTYVKWEAPGMQAFIRARWRGCDQTC